MAIGLKLGPVRADIFVVQLETTIIPTLREHMRALTRYVVTPSPIKKKNLLNMFYLN